MESASSLSLEELANLSRIAYSLLFTVAIFFAWPVIKQARKNSMVDQPAKDAEQDELIAMLRKRTHELATRCTTLEVLAGLRREQEGNNKPT